MGVAQIFSLETETPQYGRDEISLIMVLGSISVILTVVLATAHGRLDGAVPEVFSEFDDYLSNLNWPLRTHEDLLFPTLTEDQRKFAVNPSYPEFLAPIVGDPTASNNDEDESVSDEIVEDPFVSNEAFGLPKKASLKALLNEPDPRVLATAIEDERINDIYFTTIVGVTSGLMVFVIIGVGFVFHRARKNAKAAEDVEYPAYGVTGPGKDISPSSGDRKLAQNAQLYHYQHQKQQMIAFDGHADSQRRSMSDNESEDGEEGDYTVYECPGLAPTGEMEVRNPMFEDDATPKATSK